MEESNSLLECLTLLIQKYKKIGFHYPREDYYIKIFFKLISKFPSEASELCTGCLSAGLYENLFEWCLYSARFDIAFELQEKQTQKMKGEGVMLYSLMVDSLEGYLQILNGIKKSHFHNSQDLLPKIILKIDEFAEQISTMNQLSLPFHYTLVIMCYCAGGVDPQKIIKFFDPIQKERLASLSHLVLYLLESNHSDLARYFNEWKDGILKEREPSPSFPITECVLPIAEAYIDIDIKQTKEILEVALPWTTNKSLDVQEINNAIVKIWAKIDPEYLPKLPILGPTNELYSDQPIVNLFKLVQWMSAEDLRKQTM